MVRIVEFIGTALMSLGLLGLFIASVLLFIRNRENTYMWLMIGFLVSEIGRWFRILGPSYTVTKGEYGLILTESSNTIIFLINNLMMPLGISIAMVALFVIALQHGGSISSSK